MLLYLAGFLACAAVMFFAARLVYRQVLSVAHELGVPPFLISLILVAFSTSIPELCIGLASAFDGVPSFSLGDVLGSNIVNLTFIAGLVMLIGRRTIHIASFISRREMLFTFAVASMPVFLLLDGSLSRTDGVLLLALYVVYVFFIATGHRRTTRQRRAEPLSVLRSIGLFGFGVALLAGASQAIIVLASSASEAFAVPPFVIGIFAIAFSTSLPEFTFGIRAGLSRRPELSAGDVIGSCAVNASLILGLVALIHPIVPSDQSAVLAAGFFGIFVFLMYFFAFSRRATPPRYGALLLFLYFVFASFSMFG